VIRSRIGYARTAAVVTELQAPVTAGSSLAAALAGDASPPAAELLRRRASDAGSRRSESGGEHSPAPSTSAAAAAAAADTSSRPASPASQSSGLPPSVVRQGSRAGSTAGTYAAAREEGQGEEGQSAGSAGDAQHLTALQQHVARLDIRLDLPIGAAAAAGAEAGGSQPRQPRPGNSDDSRNSTSALGVWGGGGLRAWVPLALCSLANACAILPGWRLHFPYPYAVGPPSCMPAMQSP
jgi:hypothetical protein